MGPVLVPCAFFLALAREGPSFATIFTRPVVSTRGEFSPPRANMHTFDRGRFSPDGYKSRVDTWIIAARV